jgi:pimeloyl-ACP methyl ester carboxylesterase
MANPVVVMPGYFGSKLADALDKGRLLWLDGHGLLNPEVTLEALRLDIGDPDRVVPVGILDEVVILPPFWDPDVYKGLISFLRGNLELEVREFYYDWRKSLDDAADLLDKQIGRWLKDRPANAKVDLVAHSFGGLVARAYFQKHGAGRVDRLVTFGTPHKGLHETFKAIVQGSKVFTFPAAKVKQVSRAFPSSYQLIPHDAADSMFLFNGQAENPMRRDDWCQTPEMKTLLAAGAARVATLLPANLPVESFLIYGTRTMTTTSASFAQGQMSFTDRAEGDGTVPEVSAKGRGLTGTAVLRFPVPFGAHLRLFGLEKVKQRILTPILLRRDIPEIQFYAAFASEPFFVPRTTNTFAAAVCKTDGTPVPDATVRLTIAGTSVNNRIVPFTTRGDYSLNVVMPGPGGGHPYTVTAEVPDLSKPLTDRGLLVPTER